MSTGGRVTMQHAMDDFTLVLPELADIGSGDLKVYDGLDRYGEWSKDIR